MPASSKQLRQIRVQLRALASPQKAETSAWFFKTGKGQYAEGDRFIGVTVPELRKIAKTFKETSREDTFALLVSPIHEERLLALYLLIHQFEQGGPQEKRQIYDEYLAHTRFVNNWDLVDSSAYQIVGAFLSTQPSTLARKALLSLASSSLLWEQRIAMVSTFAWIKQGNSDYALLIAKKLLADKQDLIQKAVGWMLREMGKRCDVEVLTAFLTLHGHEMGRTALRYAIGRFPEAQRKAFMKRA